MEFRTILTTYGLNRLAAATASGVPIILTQMAVGDGNGNPTTPSESQVQLVGERFRHSVNRVYQDPSNAAMFTCELVIPAATGGFVIREAGIFDDAGGLFAVSNIPDTYKPTPDEGAFSDAVLRLSFIATNASVVTLQVDPNVAVATQQWIINNITAASIIPGGITGQVLTKESNSDGDYVWSDPDVANVVVDVIDEPQDLAADQTTVIWNVVTTRGLAVYIEGVRLEKGPGADQWQEDGTNPDTHITLGKSYPAGTRILGTQNEPAGAVPFPLIRQQNLSDVPDKSVARTNLDVYSKSETDQKAPPSEVAYFARPTAPAGWLKANGAAVSRTAYADLFAAIGVMYGAGDGFTTFNLPDVRGEFIRGWDDGRGADAGRTFGSTQVGQISSHGHTAFTDSQGSHQHSGSTDVQGSHSHTFGPVPLALEDTDRGDDGQHSSFSIDNQTSYSTSANGAHAHNITTSAAGVHAHNVAVNATGGNETRPRNVAFLGCIKY